MEPVPGKLVCRARESQPADEVAEAEKGDARLQCGDWGRRMGRLSWLLAGRPGDFDEYRSRPKGRRRFCISPKARTPSESCESTLPGCRFRPCSGAGLRFDFRLGLNIDGIQRGSGILVGMSSSAEEGRSLVLSWIPEAAVPPAAALFASGAGLPRREGIRLEREVLFCFSREKRKDCKALAFR